MIELEPVIDPARDPGRLTVDSVHQRTAFQQ